MDISLVTESPRWVIVLCLLAGFAGSWLLYRYDRLLHEARSWLRIVMACIRFLVISLLAFLLMTPLVKTTTRRVEKPVIIVAQDNSQSTLVGTDSAGRAQYAATLRKLITDLGADFEVRDFSFGQKVKPGTDFSFSDRETNISALFDDLNLRFLNRNVGAVLLSSDGLYNRGNNPVYSDNRLGAPIYTLAMGDSTVKKDLRVTRVVHNRTAFLGNTIPLEVLLDARQCAGEKTVLTIFKDSMELFRKEVTVFGNRFHLKVPVYLDGATRGMNRYDVRLSALPGEVSVLNNVQQVFIEVTDGKQKVLVVAAAPHPDLAAIRSVLESSLHYEMTLQWAHEFNLAGDEALVILYQLPSLRNRAADVFTRLQRSEVPLFYILGGQTALADFNKLNTGLSVSGATHRLNDALAVPAPDFSLFAVNEDLRKFTQTLPPLKAPFGDYRSAANHYVLLYQQIGIVTTGHPLLAFYTGGRKTGILSGEGFWKWRLQEFQQRGQHSYTSELLLKAVQYLAMRDMQTPFRILHKNQYPETEPLLFNAELYNASGEMFNEPELKMNIRNEQNRQFEFNFSRTGKGYQLDAGSFPAGKYRFRATVRDGDRLHRHDGEFAISPLQVEQTETTANHQLLYALAEQSGGKMLYPEEAGAFRDLLINREDVKPVIYTEKKLKDLINQKWFFFLLAGLLSLEWFMRKRSGAY